MKTLLLTLFFLFSATASPIRAQQELADWESYRLELLEKQLNRALQYHAFERHNLQDLDSKIAQELAKKPESPQLHYLMGKLHRHMMDQVEAIYKIEWTNEEFLAFLGDELSGEALRKAQSYYTLKASHSKKAELHLKKAADSGMGRYQFEYAEFLRAGYHPQLYKEKRGYAPLEVRVDETTIGLLESSYRKGIVQAGTRLATVYLKGEGSVGQDTAKGEKILSEVLKFYDSPAPVYFELGKGFLLGEDPRFSTLDYPHSLQLAERYLKKSSELNYQEADLYLGYAHLGVLGEKGFTPPDPSEAAQYLLRGAPSAKQAPYGYFALAVFYYNGGAGLAQNQEKARAMFKELENITPLPDQLAVMDWKDVQKYIKEVLQP